MGEVIICMGTIGVIALPLTLIQYFYTRERVTEERRNQVGMTKEDAQRMVVHKEATLGTQLGACLKNKYWIAFMLLVLVWQILSNMRNISLVYYSGWVVQGNAYGEYATIQAKFQMIALSPMGPGVLLIFAHKRNCPSPSSGTSGASLLPVGLRFRKRRKSTGSGAPPCAGIPLEGNPDGVQNPEPAMLAKPL